MTLTKRGTCSSSVVISSSVYSCQNCGHTEIATGEIDGGKTCPNCNSLMKLISTHAESAEDSD